MSGSNQSLRDLLIRNFDEVVKQHKVCGSAVSLERAGSL